MTADLWLVAWQVLPEGATTTSVDPIMVAQSGQSLIWLAAINVLSLTVLAFISRWADARKDRATAKATGDAAILAAKIRAEEKQLDWERQDTVARKVAEAAAAMAAATTENTRRQDAVAVRVQTAADQAADAAKLLVAQQTETRLRQDAVAARVQMAADQAAEAAKLLAAAQERLVVATQEAARITADADARVQAQLRAIDEQGRKIHILVNSDMTAARTAERDSMRLLVFSLQNALALSERLGVPVGSERAEIMKAQKRIEELDQILADRHEAQQVVEAEARAIEAQAGTVPLPRQATGDGAVKVEIVNESARPAKVEVVNDPLKIKDSTP